MKLILGQGNPGGKYAKTRHNVGFMVLDSLAHEKNISWQDKPKWKAEIAEFLDNNQKIILVKPTIFYNLTGQTLRQVADFYKIDFKNDVLIIHDDLNLDFGKLRVRQTGSDGGNNGIKSVIQQIGNVFWRLKIGTLNSKLEQMEASSFVLAKFSLKERLALKKIIKGSQEIINQFLDNKLTESSLNILDHQKSTK